MYEMKIDYIEEFCMLENKLNSSFERIDELFGETGEKVSGFLKGIFPASATQKPKGTDINSLVQRIEDIKAKHEKEKKKDMWEYQYFVIIEGEKKGPFDIKGLMNLMATGEVDKNTLVWTKGMRQWSKAGRVRILQNAFKKLPPLSPEQQQIRDYVFTPDQPQVFDYPQHLRQPPQRGNFEEGLKIIKEMVIDSIKRQISA